ncbi:MAG: hypothetical protein ABI197_01675 [Granulicella sp.]
MFHKNVPNSARSVFKASPILLTNSPHQDSLTTARPFLVASGGEIPQNHASSSRLVDLAAVSAQRCSSFFAEAAVLVLVLAVLDRLIAKGHLEMGWVVSAIAISLGLLVASIATDFTVRRWLKAH